MSNDVQAVILVGGKGTRLRPLTPRRPNRCCRPPASPSSRTCCRDQGGSIDDVVLGTSFRAEVFEEYYGDGESLGMNLRYVTEIEPLGTGGGIRNVLDELTAPDILVFNGDVLGGTDVGEVLAMHRSSGADVTMHLVRVGDPRAFGCVPTDDNGRVTAFLEKTQDPPTDQINAGTYVFRREIIEAIPAGRPVSVEREVFPNSSRGVGTSRATSTSRIGATWARRRTSCAVRPTWSAASRPRQRSGTDAASSRQDGATVVPARS